MDEAAGMQQSNAVPMTPDQTQGVPEEKVLKQSEVDELVFRLKQEAYQKGLRDAKQTSPESMKIGDSTQLGGGMGGMPQITEDQVRQMISDEAHKQNQLASAQQMLGNFAQQMGTGKSKYSDFDETVGHLGDLRSIPQVIELATGTGIAGDVMYELGKNPGKVASLTTLAYINPQLAKLEMKKLADSIKTNEQASDAPTANEPLSQVKPSTVGKDNGSNAVRDLRRKSWARG